MIRFVHIVSYTSVRYDTLRVQSVTKVSHIAAGRLARRSIQFESLWLGPSGTGGSVKVTMEPGDRCTARRASCLSWNGLSWNGEVAAPGHFFVRTCIGKTCLTALSRSAVAQWLPRPARVRGVTGSIPGTEICLPLQKYSFYISSPIFQQLMQTKFNLIYNEHTVVAVCPNLNMIGCSRQGCARLYVLTLTLTRLSFIFEEA